VLCRRHHFENIRRRPYPFDCSSTPRNPKLPL
jgi:hypothetical protein